jgi:hypothetical protein
MCQEVYDVICDAYLVKRFLLSFIVSSVALTSTVHAVLLARRLQS